MLASISQSELRPSKNLAIWLAEFDVMEGKHTNFTGMLWVIWEWANITSKPSSYYVWNVCQVSSKLVVWLLRKKATMDGHKSFMFRILINKILWMYYETKNFLFNENLCTSDNIGEDLNEWQNLWVFG